MKRVTQKKGKAEFAAKFISARGKRKASALREMDLLSELDNERILYFHDAFEKKNVVVLITELYPLSVTYNNTGATFSCSPVFQILCVSLLNKSALKSISRTLKIQSINPNVFCSPPEA